MDINRIGLATTYVMQILQGGFYRDRVPEIRTVGQRLIPPVHPTVSPYLPDPIKKRFSTYEGNNIDFINYRNGDFSRGKKVDLTI